MRAQGRGGRERIWVMGPPYWVKQGHGEVLAGHLCLLVRISGNWHNWIYRPVKELYGVCWTFVAETCKPNRQIFRLIENYQSVLALNFRSKGSPHNFRVEIRPICIVCFAFGIREGNASGECVAVAGFEVAGIRPTWWDVYRKRTFISRWSQL